MPTLAAADGPFLDQILTASYEYLERRPDARRLRSVVVRPARDGVGTLAPSPHGPRRRHDGSRECQGILVRRGARRPTCPCYRPGRGFHSAGASWKRRSDDADRAAARPRGEGGRGPCASLFGNRRRLLRTARLHRAADVRSGAAGDGVDATRRAGHARPLGRRPRLRGDCRHEQGSRRAIPFSPATRSRPRQLRGHEKAAAGRPRPERRPRASVFRRGGRRHGRRICRDHWAGGARRAGAVYPAPVDDRRMRRSRSLGCTRRRDASGAPRA